MQLPPLKLTSALHIMLARQIHEQLISQPLKWLLNGSAYLCVT